MKRILTCLLLPLLLGACTGTLEETPSLRLVIVDGPRTLRSVDARTPGTSPTTVTTTEDIVGLAGTQSGTSVAVAFANRVEVRDATLAVRSTISAPSGFTPCFTSLRGDDNGTRLAVLSSCQNATSQDVLLFAPNGTLIFRQSLPLPTFDPATLRFDVAGDTVFVARPAIGGGGEVLRVTSGAATTVLTTSAPISDLAVRGGTVFVSAGGNVTPINLTATPPVLGAPLLAVGAERLFAGGNLLVAWDADTSGGTVSITNDGTATARVPFISNLRDVTVAPDSYLYLLQRTALSRVDVVRLVETPGNQGLNVNVSDGRFLAWVVADTP